MSEERKNGSRIFDFVLEEQKWMKRHNGRKQEILSADGLKLRAMYIPREKCKRYYYMYAWLSFRGGH
mgnify:CR=1 FL=1